MKNRKLYRSRDDRVLTGLAGGIAKFFEIDASIVRAAFVIFEFATAGLLIIGYLILSVIIPLEPINNRKKVKNIAK